MNCSRCKDYIVTPWAMVYCPRAMCVTAIAKWAFLIVIYWKSRIEKLSNIKMAANEMASCKPHHQYVLIWINGTPDDTSYLYPRPLLHRINPISPRRTNGYKPFYWNPMKNHAVLTTHHNLTSDERMTQHSYARHDTPQYTAFLSAHMFSSSHPTTLRANPTSSILFKGAEPQHSPALNEHGLTLSSVLPASPARVCSNGDAP